MANLVEYAKDAPRSFKKEVHNAADWMFLPCTSIGVAKAAKYLGIGYQCLLKNADRFGLTVLYRNRRGKTGRTDRYFLLSELEPLKEKLGSVSSSDALKSAEDKDEYFKQNQKKRPKIWRVRKSRAS